VAGHSRKRFDDKLLIVIRAAGNGIRMCLAGRFMLGHADAVLAAAPAIAAQFGTADVPPLEPSTLRAFCRRPAPRRFGF